MSASNGKWELSSVAFFEPFDNFDRHARLGAAFIGLDPDRNQQNALTATNMTLTADSTISTDYSLDPFYLTGKTAYTPPSGSQHVLMGSEIILGPSTHTDFDGSIEKVTIDSISNNVLTMSAGYTNTNINFPFSPYSINDPILIRTVPLGWSVKSDFGAQDLRVSPIGRYDTRISYDSLTRSEHSSRIYSDTTNYADRQGVRLACNSNTNNNNRYIEKFTDVNTFDPRIRRWRMSFDYRLLHAQPGSPTQSSLAGNVYAKIDLGLATANNDILYKITYTDNSMASNSENNTNAQDAVFTETYTREGDDTNSNSFVKSGIKTFQQIDGATDWTGSSVLFSGFNEGTTIDSDNNWSFAGTGNLDTYRQAYHRANKFFIRIVLTKGTLSALDLDNLIIEHCQDTSKETKGIYEIDEYPEQDSLNWNIIGQQGTTSRLLNGSLKKNKSRRSKDRHTVSAQYNNVPKSIYDDLTSLIRWQDERGYKTCLRPHLTALPQAMVGYIYLTGIQTRNYDLGRVSFTLNFEEA